MQRPALVFVVALLVSFGHSAAAVVVDVIAHLVHHLAVAVVVAAAAVVAVVAAVACAACVACVACVGDASCAAEVQQEEEDNPLAKASPNAKLDKVVAS